MISTLITGGAGSIGSNFIPYFLEANEDVQIVNLDLLTYVVESHVDNSIKNPDAFIQTNVFGTFNLLNTAKNQLAKPLLKSGYGKNLIDL